MITTIVTFLTEKIVAVVITVVVVVAAVPTLIVAINGNTITITGTVASSSRHGDDEERNRLIIEVRTAAENVVVLINNEESACDLQISQLASASKLNAAATTAALQRGKTRFHDSIQPHLKQVKDTEGEFEHQKVITVSTVQTYLVRIANIQVVALGEDEHVGVLITTCQTIIIEIRQIIIIITPSHEHDIDDD